MMIIDGKRLAREREERLKVKVDQFIQKTGRTPSLVAVELSDDQGSRLYLKLKKAAAKRVGIEFQVRKRPGPARQGQALSEFQDVDGIFIQHPPGYDKKKWQQLADQIPPEKDVDGLSTTNLQLVKEGKPRFLPATVKAVGYCLLAAFSKFDQLDQLDKLAQLMKGKRIVIVGRSPIIGLPLSYWLKSLGDNVMLLYSKTSLHELRASCRAADILISTVGKPGMVTGDMVKEGAIVIDCGSPLGDVVFSEVAPKAAAITPVPGGVGPLTVVSLMENVVQSVHLAGQKRLLTTLP